MRTQEQKSQPAWPGGGQRAALRPQPGASVLCYSPWDEPQGGWVGGTKTELCTPGNAQSRPAPRPRSPQHPVSAGRGEGGRQERGAGRAPINGEGRPLAVPAPAHCGDRLCGAVEGHGGEGERSGAGLPSKSPGFVSLAVLKSKTSCLNRREGPLSRAPLSSINQNRKCGASSDECTGVCVQENQRQRFRGVEGGPGPCGAQVTKKQSSILV